MDSPEQIATDTAGIVWSEAVFPDRRLAIVSAPGGPNLWMSPDGMHWEVGEMPEVATASNWIAELDGTLVVFSMDVSGGESNSVLLHGVIDP